MAEQKKLKEKSRFSVNELVLCYEPDPMKARMLYDAKVLDVDITKDDNGKKVSEYYVHFQGWNKSWDRWVLEDQIVKDNETSRVLQRKLYDEAIKPKKKKPKSAKNELLEGKSADEKDDKSVISIGSVNSGDVEDEVQVIQLPVVTLEIPKVLATRLEDDCYSIKRKKKLIHLPRKPSTNEIFNEYYASCETIVKTAAEGKNISLKIVQELLEGLNTYFNFCLASLLLYNFEREQYYSFFPAQKPSSNIISPTSTFSPPVMPLTPRVTSPVSLANTESKESSPTNSRTSSVSEEVSGTFVATRNSRRRTGSHPGRKSIRGKSGSADDIVTQSQISLRQIQTSVKTRRSSIAHGNDAFVSTGDLLVAEHSLSSLPVTDLSPTTSASSNISVRETRSSRRNTLKEEKEIKAKEEDTIKKEDSHSTSEKSQPNPQVESNFHRLRRSVRTTHKPNNLPSESDEQEWLPIGSTAKSLQESSKPFSKPLQIKTGEQFKQPELFDDQSFMVFPQRHDGDTPADIYGVEHLLRLFVKLPVLLASSNIEEPKLTLILRYVTNFLEYLAKRNDLFNETVYSESVI